MTETHIDSIQLHMHCSPAVVLLSIIVESAADGVPQLAPDEYMNHSTCYNIICIANIMKLRIHVAHYTKPSHAC